MKTLMLMLLCVFAIFGGTRKESLESIRRKK